MASDLLSVTCGKCGVTINIMPVPRPPGAGWGWATNEQPAVNAACKNPFPIGCPDLNDAVGKRLEAR